LMGMIVGLWKGPRRQWVKLAALLAGSHLALFLPGKEFNHYYQLWVPGLVIGAGWSIMQMKRSLDQRPLMIRWSPVALGAVVVAMISIYTGLLLRYDFKQLYNGSGELGWYEAQKLARETKYWLVGKETLYQWGNEPYFYFYTGKSNPTIIWGQHATTSEFKDRFTKRILKDLKSNPPDLVVVHALFATESPDHEVLKWIRANYYNPLGGRFDKEYRYYLIHIRKGSDLARRVRSGAIRQ
jgi:hypothetical protein